MLPEEKWPVGTAILVRYRHTYPCIQHAKIHAYYSDQTVAILVNGVAFGHFRKYVYLPNHEFHWIPNKCHKTNKSYSRGTKITFNCYCHEGKEAIVLQETDWEVEVSMPGKVNRMTIDKSFIQDIVSKSWYHKLIDTFWGN